MAKRSDIASGNTEVTLAEGTVENPVMVSAAVGGTAVSAGGFDRVMLEEVYGYTAEEAADAENFLQGIRLPETFSTAALAEFYSGIQRRVVRNRGKSREVFRADMLGLLEETKKAGNTPARSMSDTVLTRRGTPEKDGTGILPFFGVDSVDTMQQAPSEFAVMGHSGIHQAAPTWEHGHAVGSNRSEAARLGSYENPVPITRGPEPRGQSRNGSHYETGNAATVASGGVSPVLRGNKSGEAGTAALPLQDMSGGIGEVRLPSGGETGNPAQDPELERLRRIEANYERDKAMLAKEKAPALARSDSHEVGHAEGGEEEENSTDHTINRMSKKFNNMLKDELLHKKL
jgi:hypothetical protein